MWSPALFKLAKYFPARSQGRPLLPLPPSIRRKLEIFFLQMTRQEMQLDGRKRIVKPLFRSLSFFLFSSSSSEYTR